MIAVYSGNKKEVKISGKPDEWVQFAQLILVDKETVSFASINDPTPYAEAASKMLIQHDTSTKVCINISCDGNVVISGSRLACSELSEIVMSFASEFHSGEHFHFDPVDSQLVNQLSAEVVLHLT